MISKFGPESLDLVVTAGGLFDDALTPFFRGVELSSVFDASAVIAPAAPAALLFRFELTYSTQVKNRT